ncbi:hypothetical protein MESMUL_23100 [Mesosutterella multiformis]|uniref:Uncharacterized protein n=1 Tax=Mesosutterella multiformis TaxID=2259133 RepID=A0A388SF93_9BURK|nr:hypothetical protein [Mesosutterella multiformis]GBO94956.1 hypothetical protein MESMUL_23100 [Mesosutterella multiformis]
MPGRLAGAEEDEAREGEDHQCPCDSSNPDPSDTDREERVEPERPNTGPSKIMQPLTHEAGKRIKTSENREPAEHREHPKLTVSEPVALRATPARSTETKTAQERRIRRSRTPIQKNRRGSRPEALKN